MKRPRINGLQESQRWMVTIHGYGFLLVFFTVQCLQAEIRGIFVTQPRDTGLVTNDIGDSVIRSDPSAPEEAPSFSMGFTPTAEQSLPADSIKLGELAIELSNANARAEKLTVALQLTQTDESMLPLQVELPLQFRLFPSESSHQSSLTLLAPTTFQTIELNGQAYELDFQLGTNDSESPGSVVNTVHLAVDSNTVQLTAQLLPLPTIKAEASGTFVEPRGPETMVVSGTNRSTIDWGTPFGTRTKANQFTVETDSFEATTEIPVQIGKFIFFNSTVTTPSIITGLNLNLSLKLETATEPVLIPFQMNVIGTRNSGDLVADADIIEIDSSNTGNPIPGTDLYLYLRFENPSLPGFTQGDGFAAMEDQEAEAEIWAILSRQPILPPKEIQSRFEFLNQATALSSQGRWRKSEMSVPGTTIREIDIADYNGDTIQDLAVVTRGFARVWLRDSTEQTFREAPQFRHSNHGVAAFGDFNGDGTRDIALLGQSLVIGLNNGAGEFIRSTQELEGAAGGDLVAGDIDGDGDLDLVAALFGSRTLVTHFNSGTGTFEESTTKQLDTTNRSGHGTLKKLNMVLEDLDNDNDLDLAIARVDSYGDEFFGLDDYATAVIWFNAGKGRLMAPSSTFSDTSGRPLIFLSNNGNDIATGDIDHDGDIDVVIPNFTSGDFGPSGTLKNIGTRVFLPTLSRNLGSGVSKLLIDDLDEDGLADAITGGGVPTVVRMATGPGSFLESQTLTEASVSAMSVGDLNDDDLKDIVIASRSGIDIWVRDVSASRQFAKEATIPAHIEDPIVEKVIANHVGKPADRLTLLDLALIRDLRFSNNGLTELNLPLGLINLEVLAISHNSISDLRLPPDVTKLRELYHSNPSADFQKGISTVTVGPRFHTLESIGFLGLGVKELVFEAEMPHLTTIGLWANRIRDVSFLRKTPALKQLNLGDNGIRSVLIPVGPRKIESITLSMNPIQEVKRPRGLQIDQLHGFSIRKVEDYESAIISSPPTLDPARGYVFEIRGTDGPVEIKSSNDLRTWRTYTEVNIDNWSGELVVPIDTHSEHKFFKTFRPSFPSGD